VSIFGAPHEESRGTGLNKDEGVIWILVIGLVIFAIAIFFVYAVP
jgi:hypothetical protein